MLIVGAQSALRWVRPGKSDPWIVDLLGRKPRVLAGVALANKMARIAWALMAHGGSYRAPATIAAAA